MFFYLSKVIFAVLDVSFLPIQKCQTLVEVFFSLILLASASLAATDWQTHSTIYRPMLA